MSVPGWTQVVLHVDMDAFYASVEQARRPELRGMPVVVGADPKEGRGRGVVTAASYEARRFGVRSAMPISLAWQRCPHAVFLPPDFTHYHEVSGRVMATLEAHADTIEVAGMDEAYLDVTGAVHGEADIEALARRLQDAVRAATGLSCSVGAAEGKVTAKIASDLRKPGGVTVVPPTRAREVLAGLPARAIPGIGPKTAERLAVAGIATVNDLATLEEARMQGLLGSSTAWFRRVAHGRDTTPVAPWEGPPKSIGNESTFAEDLADPAKVGAEVAELARHVAARLQRHGFAARTVTIKVRFADFSTHTRAKTLPWPARTSEAVEETAVELLATFLEDGRAFRLVGVRVSGLEQAGGQRRLDEWA